MPLIPFAALLRSRWLHYGVLALALAVLWLRGNHYERSRDAWQSAFTAQKAAFTAAQAAAEAAESGTRIRHEDQNAASNLSLIHI